MEESFWEKQLRAEREAGFIPPESDSPEPKLVEFPDSEFDDSLSLDLMGLLRIGALQEEVEIWGHKILLKTLTVGEELEASLLAQRYAETLDSGRAYATALVAASIVTVNHQPLIRELGPGENDSLQKRYDFIRNGWYWPVIQVLYQHYTELVQRADESLRELIKK